MKVKEKNKMIDIEYIDKIEDKYYITINEEFNKYASKNRSRM